MDYIHLQSAKMDNPIDINTNEFAYMAIGKGNLSVYSATPSTPRYEIFGNFSAPSSSNLKLKNLGKSGLKLPIIGFSIWSSFGSTLSETAAEELIESAYKNGINYFDTGDAFLNGHCESILGNILKKKEWKRSSFIVSTKLFWNKGPNLTRAGTGLSRKFILEALEESLERLQLNYVDIVLINKLDGMCPTEEIVRTMATIINKGLAFYWGTSRWSPIHIMEAFSVARQFNCPPPICEQMEYHMFNRDKMELYMPEIYHKLGIGAITWSNYSLNNDEGIALISRKAANFEEKSDHNLKLAKLNPIISKLSGDLSQFSIAWAFRNENVNCVLISPRSLDQLYLQLNALKLIPKLTPIVLEEIEKVLENRPNVPKVRSVSVISNVMPAMTEGQSNIEERSSSLQIDR